MKHLALPATALRALAVTRLASPPDIARGSTSHNSLSTGVTAILDTGSTAEFCGAC